MDKKVTQIDDLVEVNNVIIYVSDYSNLDVLIKGLQKHCPRANIYTPVASFGEIHNLIEANGFMGSLYTFNQLVLEHEISRTLVEPLQSRLFLGILSKTYCIQHQKLLKETKSVPIDLIIMNFGLLNLSEGPNDFESVSTRVDVGGQAILSSAVTNSPRVMTISDLDDYQELVDELEKFKGQTCLKSRYKAAVKSAEYNNIYSTEVHSFFNSVDPDEVKGCYTIENSAEDYLAAEKIQEEEKAKKAKKLKKESVL